MNTHTTYSHLQDESDTGVVAGNADALDDNDDMGDEEEEEEEEEGNEEGSLARAGSGDEEGRTLGDGNEEVRVCRAALFLFLGTCFCVSCGVLRAGSGCAGLRCPCFFALIFACLVVC